MGKLCTLAHCCHFKPPNDFVATEFRIERSSMRSLVLILMIGIGASALPGCTGGSSDNEGNKPQAGFTKKGATKAAGGRGPEEGEPPTLPPGSYSKK
jgi:hypothetical protein